MTTANTNEDKLILGGHEFTSRFILGSGKFSLDLVKACIEKAGTQIVTLALRRANEGGLATSWTMCRRTLHFFRIHPVPETHRRQSASQDFPVSLAAEIL